MTIPGQTTVYDFLDDDECALAHLSAAWAVWTLGWSAPDTALFSKSSPTHIDVPCWLDTGRTSRATTTCEPSTEANGSDESTCWPAGSRAKTYPKPVAELGFTDDGQACSSTSPESQMTLLAKADLFWSKTSPDYSVPTVAEISPSFSRSWPSSGFTTSPGESWTAVTSECPNGGGVSSYLADVLLAEVAPRFFLSQKAAAGILRRSTRRRKPIPEALRTALATHARSPNGQAHDTTAKPKISLSTGNELPDPLATGQADSEPPTLMESVPMLVRRLTPTEFERLQGLPDLWTVVET